MNHEEASLTALQSALARYQLWRDESGGMGTAPIDLILADADAIYAWLMSDGAPK